jgi:HK97 gp10 family phage protein
MAKALFEIEGFAKLQTKIKRLDDKVKRREVLKILGQAANPTVKAARVEAPKSKKPHVQAGKRTYKIIQPGNLKKSIGKIRGKRGSAKINAVLYVGPRAKGRKNDGWYGAMVHGGTVHQSPNPFMDRAYNKTKGKVTADAEQKIKKYIDKQVTRLSTK